MGLSEMILECKRQWQAFFGTLRTPPRCIHCEGENVSWRGTSSRKVSMMVQAQGQPQVTYLSEVPCRRVQCRSVECGRSWTLRPPGVIPRRHYQLCVVASATSRYLHEAGASLEAVAAAHNCSRRTLGRWLRWQAQLAKAADLQRHLLDVADAPILPKLQPLVPTARKPLVGSCAALLAAAAAVLGLLEVLGAALGYEPPGLRSVLEIVINNRDRVSTLAEPAVPEFARRRMRWPLAACAM